MMPVKRVISAFVPIGCAVVMAVAPTPASAQQCQLCGDGPPGLGGGPPGRSLRIDIETDLEFARYAVLSDAGGYAELDPVTGQRRTYGGLGDMGGLAVTARVTLRGQPNRAVRVDLPSTIELRAAGGDRIELTNLSSTLPGQPRLDADGRLEFRIGGRINVDGTDAGNFRGRLRVSAEYE